jgi:signal transduction histidine kinase
MGHDASLSAPGLPRWRTPRTGTPRRRSPSCGTWKGIHPAVLDRGLAAALAVLAEASAVPVGLTVNLGERPSQAIEAIAYFCAAELLANVAKHSGASRAAIGVSEEDGRLLMSVADDGAGRARLKPGGGLAGLSFPKLMGLSACRP